MTPNASLTARSETSNLLSRIHESSGAVEQAAPGNAGSRQSEEQVEAERPVLSKEMSLFELDESLCLLMESAVEAAAANSGEIPKELQQALLTYCEAFGDKVDNIARYIRSQEFEAANASVEIDRLKQRTVAAENRVERLKGLLRFFMGSRNLRSMKGRLNTISLRKNSQDSLILIDATKVPVEFWRVSLVLNGAEWKEVLSHLPPQHELRARLENPNAVKHEMDNARIRAFLAAGNAIEGAELRREHHIRLT